MYGRRMQDRRHDETTDVERPRREPEPAVAPAPRAGSLAWASAVGNAAVARMAAQQRVAREAVVEEEEQEVEAPEPAPDAVAEPEAPEAAPEAAEAPPETEGLAMLDALPEDSLPE
jgi:hypothetical protein